MKPETIKIHGLIYGDYPDLHERFLEVLKHKPVETPVFLWLNQPGAKSRKLVEKFADVTSNVGYHCSLNNTYKYVAMRRMFSKLTPEIEWVVWFDDDVRIDGTPNWFKLMTGYIEEKRSENICYVGQPWFVDYLPGQFEFIQASKWYRGVGPKVINGRARVEFAQGSYWWLRTDVQQKLDWPDLRLEHNGGDTLLGEAVRQQELPFHKFWKGIKPNDSRRRGFHQKPAGSHVDCRR
jgi:hypothetical protein